MKKPQVKTVTVSKTRFENLYFSGKYDGIHSPKTMYYKAVELKIELTGEKEFTKIVNKLNKLTPFEEVIVTYK